ncbi:MAG TPA: arginine--tRNA ligase [Patescibacteria group bacterium]|nr:arginine--tRNA ligase [Patescibacteria group bacterium]
MKMVLTKVAEELEKALDKKIDQSFFSIPPKPEMGNICYPFFELAQKAGTNPAELAEKTAQRIKAGKVIEKVKPVGPYLNFFINPEFLAENYLMNKQNIRNNTEKKKIMIEFAHPNTHKAFHIGHLRNIITGESLCRILDYLGHEVIRVNYQGDIGMHIAKCLWGVQRKKAEYESIKKENLDKKIEFLSGCYAFGAQSFEKEEKTKKEIKNINQQVYEQSEEIKEIYQETKKWSLDYFDRVYKRLGTHFDRFYFESEVFEKGRKMVFDFLDKGVFKESEGAVIFEGEKYGLHNRVFVNSAGQPTYEGKEVALADLQMNEYNPDKIIHVVGKEQTEYFKVIFQALEEIVPGIRQKEEHLAYGWVGLKSGKMSSRTGKVVLAEWLLSEVKKQIAQIMEESEQKNSEEIKEKVTLGAVKYAMLRLGVDIDMSFDIKESISLSGNSGPYLMYILARVNSILKKHGKVEKLQEVPEEITDEEKQLLLKIADFDSACLRAGDNLDPSELAKYLFGLAKVFNEFYDRCPILRAKGEIKVFRLNLIKEVREIMKKGLLLLGIDIVEKM